jgi:hypothetical protein
MIRRIVTFFSSEENRSDRYLEATAIAVIAWLNDFERYGPNIQRAIGYLI